MSATAVRRPASPYARRLARERGLSLDLIAGTGPNGRIVAADIEAFAARRKAHPEASTTTAAAPTSVFGVSIDIARLNQLVADLKAAGTDLSLDDMLVRAGAQALEAVPGARNGAEPIIVALERGAGAARRSLHAVDAHIGLVSALHARLEESEATAESGAPPGAAALSIRRFAIAGIRAVAMPLVDEIPLRL
ncbi:MAG: E3 binding domain-containing protein, partial [Devosia sp.]